MGLEDLTATEILRGNFTLIFVLISLIIGIKVFITVGLTWIFLSSAWWGVSLAFINDIFFDAAIDPFFKRIIARIFLPFAVMCWIYSFSTLVYPSSKKKDSIDLFVDMHSI
ncbi:MAG: hypothetical protein ACTSRI_08590 [Promethearchaeota archaeon]